VKAAAAAAGIYHPKPKKGTFRVKGNKGKDGSLEAHRADDGGV
jgi:hypothetical protein